MNPEFLLSTVKSWCDLLREIASIEVDFDLSSEELALRIARRQISIDAIQKLDTPLREAARLKKQGWPNVPQSVVNEIEELVIIGKGICLDIVQKDGEVIEIARKSRGTILGKIRETSLGKGYSSRAYLPQFRPPVILDGNA